MTRRWCVFVILLFALTACKGQSEGEAAGEANAADGQAQAEAGPDGAADKPKAKADGAEPEANAAQDPSNAAQPAGTPATLSLGSQLAAHGAWLPGDFAGAGLLDAGAMRSDMMGLAQTLMPTFTPDKQKAMMDDLGGLMTGRLGINPIGAKSVLVAVGGGWMTAVIGGSMDLSALPKKTVAGQSVHEAKGGVLFMPMTSGDAVAMFPEPKALEGFLKAQKAGTLEAAPAMAKMKGALDAAGPGLLTVVVNIQNPMVKQALASGIGRDLEKLTQKKGLEGFDLITVRSDASTMRLSLVGSKEVMGQLHNILSGLVKKFSGEIQVAKSKVGEMDFEEAMAVTTAFHLMGPASDALMPKLEGDALTLQVPTFGGGGAVAMMGVFSAIAIPAFLKYIRDSKTSEGEENLKMIGDGAVAYFQSEHAADDTGLSVISKVYPESPQWACTDGAEPNSMKVMPNPATFSKEPWKSLRFSISKPHYFRYCYKSSEDRKRFVAVAEAALDSDQPDTFFCVKGQSQAGNPIIGVIMEVDSRRSCDL